MDKVTQINIEGHNYELLAGGTVEGTCASQGADWTKLLVLPEGAALVDGMFLAIAFTYGNTAGFDAPKTVYSDDGVNFYRDAQLTDAITLPDPRNYTVTLVSGEEYSLIEYPALYFQSEVFPVCDAKGHLRGGSLWKDGDTAVLLFVDDKFFVMSVSGGGGADINVYPTMTDLEQDLPNLEDGQFVATEEGETWALTDTVANGNMNAVTSNAVAQVTSGMTRVKTADYVWSGTMSSVYEQNQIPLSSFASDIDPNKVIGFTVLYWTGFQAIANGDWYDSTGLACALTCLKTGTGYAKVRCSYFV
jgi:hypothetical protein